MKCIKEFLRKFSRKKDIEAKLIDKKYVDPITLTPDVPDEKVEDVLKLTPLLAKEAHKWVGTVEVGGDNKGPEVEMFQRAVDGKATREPWCMCMVQFLIKEIEKRFGVVSPIYKTEHVQTCWNKTPIEQRIEKPEVGCLMLWNYKGTTNGHVGIVSEILLDGYHVKTIEGNTGPGESIVREGDGVYLKTRHIRGGSKFVVLGFLRPFKS